MKNLTTRAIASAIASTLMLPHQPLFCLVVDWLTGLGEPELALAVAGFGRSEEEAGGLDDIELASK
jgi:hypothetical protein